MCTGRTARFPSFLAEVSRPYYAMETIAAQKPPTSIVFERQSERRAIPASVVTRETGTGALSAGLGASTAPCW